MKIAIFAIAACLVACEPIPERTWGADQCLRAKIFQQCLQTVPAGPQSTKYNDWDEVVGACEDAAYRQSIREKSQIKEECKS